MVAGQLMQTIYDRLGPSPAERDELESSSAS